MAEISKSDKAARRTQTLVGELEADPGHNLELAAARAEVRVAGLLRRAFEASAMSQRDLAERVGVTEGRVSQVLNSEGNLRVTTIARYLRALGYSFELYADLVSE